MKSIKIAGIFLLFLLFPAWGLAQSRYVNDIIKITFRTGPGVAHKVVDELESGQRVELIRTEGSWSEVKLPSGKTGWVLSRFLTAQVPNKLELAKVKEEKQQLAGEMEKLKGQNTTLTEENSRLSDALQSKADQLENLNTSYQSLQTDCADYLKMKNAFERSATERDQQAQRLETLEIQLKNLERQRNIKWFLAGSGVLLLGILIGVRTRRNKRSSYL